jgi:PAS domain S-box-containing protein
MFRILGKLPLNPAQNSSRIKLAIVLAVILPVLSIGAYAYLSSHRELTEFTLSRRQSIALLAASALEQRFERVRDISVSLATRVRFRQLVAQEKWQDAIAILTDIKDDFPFIERIFLADPAGTLMADIPALPEVRGKNFALRDWYQGVTKGWRPYISDVYQRSAEPRYNVIAVAVPVRSDERAVVGILVLQIRVESLIGWSKEINVGPSGFLYFVDKKGRVAAHPRIAADGDIADYSSLPVVQKVLSGGSGIERFFNTFENEERLSAYASVRSVGWGVIATEPTRTAFARRDDNLNDLLIRYGFILLMSCLLAVAILRAVQKQERAEAEKRRSEALLNSVVENNPVMIFLKEAKDLRFILFNQAAEEITGYTRGEVIGKNDHDLFPPEEAERFTAKDRAVLDLRGAMDFSEERIHTKHRGQRFLHTRRMALLDDKGEPEYLLGVSEDITERKSAEEAVRQLNADLAAQSSQLKAANKELEAFSYSVSHDLRAPLRSIDGFSQALLEDYAEQLDSTAQNYLRRVRAASQRMAELIDDLLNLSRVSRTECRLETTDLSAMTKQVVAELRQREPQRSIEIAVPEGILAKGDSRLLKVILENLIGNAWKFTAKTADAKIMFGESGDNGEHRYFVRDNGAGFDPTYAKKLFGAFQRLHDASEFPGTGIGLATVQRIVHRHGGTIWAEGKPNEGATFYFTLPN